MGIERKTIWDLLNSMVTGRFSGHQLPGLMDSYQYVYLLVEGMYRYHPTTGLLEVRSGNIWRVLELGGRRFMAKEVVGFLNTLMVKCSLMVLHTSEKIESVQMITSLYHWWSGKEWDSHASHMSRDRSGRIEAGVELVKASLVRRVAAELSGVGWGKSREVDKFFSSVEDMVAADEATWRKVPGIGKELSRRIVTELAGGKL